MSLRSERQGRVGEDPGNDCVCNLARLGSFAEYVQIFLFKGSKILGGAGGGGGGWRLLWVNFAGYVPLAYQNPYPIIVYSVAML